MPVISTNLAANSAVRYLNINSASQTSSLSKLASGSRITQASDDAAGLAISTKISSDVTALTQAATNASHGISVLQTADGGASNISDILQRMKALASQASSGTVTNNERAYIDAEFQQLIKEVDAIAVGTRYNGQSLLDGSSAFAQNAALTGGINVMVGSDADDVIKVTLDTLNAAGLGLATAADRVTVEGTGTLVPPATVTVAGTGSTGTKTEVGDALVPATAGTGALLAGSIDVTTGAGLAAINAGLSFTVNGSTVTIPAGGTATDGAGALAIVQTALAAATPALVPPVTVALNGTALDFSQAGNTTAEAEVDIAGASTIFAADGTDTGTGFVAAVPAAAPADVVLDLTGGDIDVSGGNFVFEINGVAITLTAAGSGGDNAYDVTELKAAIDAAAVPGITATVTGTTVELANSATGATASTVVEVMSGGDLTDVGLTLDGGTNTATAVANMTLNVGAAGISAGAGDVSFDINGTTITLNTAADADADGSWSAAEIEDVITTAAISGITATVAGNTVVLANSGMGAGAQTQIDTFVNANAATLGLTADIGTGNTAPADVTLTVGAAGIDATGGDVSFTINGVAVDLNTAADADADGVWSAAEIADVINTGTIPGVSATVVANNVVINNRATGAAAETIVAGLSTTEAATLGLTLDASEPLVDTTSQATAVAALSVLDTAINTVSSARANIGSLESRFAFHQASIATSIENLTAAVSSIRDTDIASEAAKLASAKVKTQAAVAAAAQASQMPQELLRLLQ